MKLGVFINQAFYNYKGRISTDLSFVRFIESFGEHFSKIKIFAPTKKIANPQEQGSYPCSSEITALCQLPYYDNVKALAIRYGLEKVVTVAGAIPHPQLGPWFDAATVGVAYVPMTDYYDCQPVTKTFEYLLSGMAVIATNTSENRKIIDSSNGVLVGDKAEDFYLGLKLIYQKRKRFESAKIRQNAIGFTWKSIVENNLKPYFARI